MSPSQSPENVGGGVDRRHDGGYRADRREVRGHRGADRPPRQRHARSSDIARRVAYDTLRAVDERDAYANLVLPALLDQRRLDSRDAGLATELAYGTLRALGTYDAIIAACVDRPFDEIAPETRDLLRLGAHQLLATRVPAHAAVATTVDLAAAVLGLGPSRFVNAVLRQISERDLDAWIGEIAPDAETDPEGHLALAYAHPRWVVSALWDSLAAHRGRDRAREEITDLLKADNERPHVTLVARPGLASRADLCEAAAAVGLHAEPASYSPYGAYLAEGDPLEVGPVARGRAGVQDEGSQLVALALADAELVGRDARWLDLCAGPGGKAALLAGVAAERGQEGSNKDAPTTDGDAAAEDHGALLVAVEIASARARLVRRALRTLREVSAETLVVVADGTTPAWQPGAFDRVLADVPCSGLGALRRRPESRWRRGPQDVAALAVTQRELLRSALDAVRPGGVVAYVTCSPHVAETRVVVGDVLRGREDVERVDARAYLPGVPELGDGPDVQLWPHLHGTDAMYLALLRLRS